MKVTILGSAGMYATPSRAASGYLVELGGTRIWLDAGAGTWRNLLAHVDYTEIDGVVLTHRHPDHVTDVFQAFHARQYGASEPLEPVPLWAPGETLERVLGFARELDTSFDLREIKAGDALEVGGARISLHEMAHSVETVGVRIESGETFAYSADTGPGGDLDALAAGADVFLCEATFQNSDPPWEGHLSAAQAGSIAARAGVGRLVITHLRPGRDDELSLAEAEAASGDVPVELAHDGMALELRA
ncbi:MAG: MBL fold metallo-hydrolase [Actinomycetota bacterium]|nr:MBL fold metallo-hydrolase [Actinomycetota bacterium]